MLKRFFLKNLLFSASPLKDEIVTAIKNKFNRLSAAYINFYGAYDFMSYLKRVYNLIEIDKEKEFTQALGLEN